MDSTNCIFIFIINELHLGVDYVILLAAGSGSRLGSEIPKQFLMLAHQPIIKYSVDTFLKALDQPHFILVLSEAYLETPLSHWQIDNIQQRCTIVKGGETRFHSVKNALNAICDVKATDLVFIHDTARPFVSVDLVLRCKEHATQYQSAIPSIAVKDSLRLQTENGSIPIERNNLLAMQTPQTFSLPLIKDAYNTIDWQEHITDDAMVYELHGHAVKLVIGDELNFKITTPLDLKLARTFVS
jgi:4-diphosphocytidyl-2-methyl-D-erithritol synthase